MTTTVTIKTTDNAARVHTNTSSSTPDGKYQSYTNVSQVLEPNSETTLSIYGNGNLSVSEEPSDEDFNF